MKKLATLALIFLIGNSLLAQTSDAKKFIQFVQQPKQDSLVLFCNSLFESGRTTAAMMLLESATSAESQELKNNITKFKAGEDFSISTVFNNETEKLQGIISRVKSNKNKKVKKAVLDSLLAIHPIEKFVAIAHMNACVDLALMNFNKKAVELTIAEYSSIAYNEKNLVVKHFFLNQLINAATRSKNVKKKNELIEMLNSNSTAIQEEDSTFQKEIIKEATAKVEAPKVTTAPVEEPKSNLNSIVLIIASAIILVLVFVIVLVITKKNKAIQALKSSMNEIEDRSNHDAHVQNQSIRHHETQLQEARQSIQALQLQNSSQIKQFDLGMQELDQNMAEFQNDLKLAIDKATRDYTVQNMMELNNLLTRNSQKMRENIKSLRIYS